MPDGMHAARRQTPTQPRKTQRLLPSTSVGMCEQLSKPLRIHVAAVEPSLCNTTHETCERKDAINRWVVCASHLFKLMFSARRSQIRRCNFRSYGSSAQWRSYAQARNAQGESSGGHLGRSRRETSCRTDKLEVRPTVPCFSLCETRPS